MVEIRSCSNRADQEADFDSNTGVEGSLEGFRLVAKQHRGTARRGAWADTKRTGKVMMPLAMVSGVRHNRILKIGKLSSRSLGVELRFLLKGITGRMSGRTQSNYRFYMQPESTWQI